MKPKFSSAVPLVFSSAASEHTFTSGAIERSSPNENGSDADYKKRIKHSVGLAQKYTHRKPVKHQAEMRLIEKGFKKLRDVGTVLDAPCGVGRATAWLSRNGYQTTGIDLGEAAVEMARSAISEANVAARILIEDIEQMRFPDRSFDATLCFRLLHHFPRPDIRSGVIRELCRVSRRYVLISYLSPWSPTSMRRLLRNKLLGTPIRQHATTLSEISSYFGLSGFSLLCDIPQQAFLHSLHLAVFERK